MENVGDGDAKVCESKRYKTEFQTVEAANAR